MGLKSRRKTDGHMGYVAHRSSRGELRGRRPVRSRNLLRSPRVSDMTTDTRQGIRTPQPGDVILGKYELQRVLGAGGMGTVFAARHVELDRQVAVKFLHTGFDNSEVAARFLREARAAAKIESEHVARVLDVARLDDQTPFIVMEHLEGEDLSDVLERGHVPIGDAVDYVVQVCSAMLEAHQLGIVHRDLKPANLFLTRRRDGSPVVKVLDFGISKWSEPDSSRGLLTNPTEFLGSPAYMSPEQLRSALSVDHRTDIWSIGVILFELLGGRLAFDAPSLAQLMASILNEPPLDLRPLRPEVPDGLVSVVERCLAKDRDQRFADVVELAMALMPYAPMRTRWDIERISRSSGFAVTALSEPPPRIPAPPAVPSSSSGVAQPSGSSTAVSPANSAGSATGQVSTGTQSLGSGSRNQGTVTPWVGERESSAAVGKSRARTALLVGLSVAVGGVAAVGAWIGLSSDSDPPVAASTQASQQPAIVEVAPAGQHSPIADPKRMAAHEQPQGEEPARPSGQQGEGGGSRDGQPDVRPLRERVGAGSTEPLGSSTSVVASASAQAPSGAASAEPRSAARQPTTATRPVASERPVVGVLPAGNPKQRSKPKNPLEMNLK